MWAESAAPDPNPACPVSQFEAGYLGKWRDREASLLSPFSDHDGIAAQINDHGQVVGASGTCAAFNPNSGVYLAENHALLWENGAVTDLGNLGGTGGIAGNHACAINNRGQVVGHSELTNNTTFHGFLWTKDIGHAGPWHPSGGLCEPSPWALTTEAKWLARRQTRTSTRARSYGRTTADGRPQHSHSRQLRFVPAARGVCQFLRADHRLGRDKRRRRSRFSGDSSVTSTWRTHLCVQRSHSCERDMFHSFRGDFRNRAAKSAKGVTPVWPSRQSVLGRPAGGEIAGRPCLWGRSDTSGRSHLSPAYSLLAIRN